MQIIDPDAIRASRRHAKTRLTRSALAWYCAVTSLLGGACAHENKVAPTESATKTPPEETEAADAVQVIRRLYPLGQSIGAEDWKWATCHDETKGYTALLACERGVSQRIADLAKSLPPEAIATQACGRTIEAAHRQYIQGQAAFHADHLAWLERLKPKLTVPMAGKSQSDACDEKLCADEPHDFQPKYGAPDGANYGHVNSVECVKELFDCAPPTGNVCWINKVANRLGVGPEPKPGAVTVKATGAIVQ